jgi:transcriptional regulator with GAF, ATPase, and Fis domain
MPKPRERGAEAASGGTPVGRISITTPEIPGDPVNVPRLELSVEREAGAKVSRQVVLEGELFRIGSHPVNDLILEDKLVSRFHCSITRTASGFRLTDSGSLNGTRLAPGGQGSPQGVRIRDADLHLPECRIELGGSSVLVRDIGSVTEVATSAALSFGDVIGTALPMRRLYDLLKRVARSDADVLIEGESGTGKELVATELVRRSTRAGAPLVIVDCGAISPSLIESELFGHVRGAFTGALKDRAGAFESADGGTVFLDEIGELPLDMQPKLLRALAAREIRRIGDGRQRKVDVRVIAATNRRLEREVNSGRFREDLYYRLSVVTVRVPPLRERIDDVRILVNAFLTDLDALDKADLFPAEVIDEMKRYEWPGNVRELRNYVERRVVLGEGALGRAEDDARAASPSGAPPRPSVDLELPFKDAKEVVIASFERAYLTALLSWADGNVSRAARKANLDRMYLHRLLQRHGLRRSGALGD